MKKKTIIGYLIASLLILCAWLQTDNQSAVQSLTTIQDPYQVEEQNAIQTQIDDMKANETYTPEHMLLLHDPYGTNTLSMYVYFESEDPVSLTYNIHVDGLDINDFTRTISSDYMKEYEVQLLSLVPDVKNEITFTLLKENGISSTYTVSYQMGSLKGQEALQLDKTTGTSTQEISEGLYAILGNDSEEKNFVFLYDNDGVLRGEIPLTDYRSDRLVFHDDLLYFSNDRGSIAAMNAVGQIVQAYQLGQYEMHHDFVIDEQDNLLVLATDTTKTSEEDQIIRVDIETGNVELIADFTDLMALYYVTCTDETSDTLDWLHFNTIQYMGDNSVLLSSRETGTIIKLSDIYDKATIEYMMGEKSFWKDSTYEDLLLNKKGTFTSASGQHSITYVQDDSLKEGQYYVYMFNNNFGYTKTQSNYSYTQLPGVVTDLEDEQAVSKYYKYLVDETTGTYELVDSFDVPFSAYVSSAQEMDSNIIINSGLAGCFQEYDDQHTLIQKFEIEAEQYIYRVYKYTFDGFYFYK